MTACQMIPRAWADDGRCNKIAIGTHEHTVRVCLECAIGLMHEGFVIVFDHHETPAAVGDRFRFVYPEADRAHDTELTVVRVCGTGPDDLVFFNDTTHSKQKHLAKVIKVS